MRKRQTIGLALVAVLAVLACGDGARMVGDAMVEAGTMLSDAGDAMRPDAQAQPAVEVPCNVVREQAITYSGGNVVTTTVWYAEVRDATIDPAAIRDVQVMLCGRETFGDVGACPTGATCDGEYPYLPADCTTGGAAVDPGVIRVQCGARLRSSIGATDSGERRMTARVTVVR